MDFNIKLKNGQVLKGIILSPGEKTKAVIVMVHGLGEHIQRYTQWAGLFTREGIGFAGVDLPGHGRSEGRRGYIRNYRQTDEMISILLNTTRQTFPGMPVYLYGHSLGGGIVLDYILRMNPRIRGAVVTSPWLRLSFEPQRIKVIMAAVIKYILPGLVQPSGLNINHISHDEAVVQSYRTDPLVHGKISVSLFCSAINAGHYSLKHAPDLKVPVLILHGADDLITSPAASLEFAEKTGKAEIKIWTGGYHELHNEPFRDEVFNFILNWINQKRK